MQVWSEMARIWAILGSPHTVRNDICTRTEQPMRYTHYAYAIMLKVALGQATLEEKGAIIYMEKVCTPPPV